MRTSARRGQVSAEEAASALQDPFSLTVGSPLDSGWQAGRLIDGYDFQVAGKAPVWTPPQWIRRLEREGYDRTVEGEPFFVVTQAVMGELGRFGDLREAFRFALGALKARRDRPHPESMLIECRTPSGRCTPVVFGRPLIGMARGALEAEPIRVIEAPAD